MTKFKEPYSLCSECRHIREKVRIKRVCKLNCVERSDTDTCLWTGKRYPCKFEQKKPEKKPTTVLEALDELDLLYQQMIKTIDDTYPKIMPERERGQIIGLLDARCKIKELKDKVALSERRI